MRTKVEIFRVLRYVGTPMFIAKQMDRRGVKGRHRFGVGQNPDGSQDGYIEESFLGETPVELEEPNGN